MLDEMEERISLVRPSISPSFHNDWIKNFENAHLRCYDCICMWRGVYGCMHPPLPECYWWINRPTHRGALVYLNNVWIRGIEGQKIENRRREIISTEQRRRRGASVKRRNRCVCEHEVHLQSNLPRFPRLKAPVHCALTPVSSLVKHTVKWIPLFI